MSFIKHTAGLDLETTAVENLFLTDIMPIANGDALKVYLLGYRYACDPACCDRFSNEVLARHLGLSLDTVLSAWDFWAERGLVRKIASEGAGPADYSVAFVSVRQLYIENNFEPRQMPGASKIKTPTADQVADAVMDQKKMFREIEALLGRPLYPNDCMDILEWIDTLNLDAASVLKAFEYAVHEKKAPNINYVAKVVRSWYSKGGKPPQSQPAPPVPRPRSEKGRSTNRFHNFEGQLSQLSDSELEALIRNRTPRKKSTGGSAE